MTRIESIITGMDFDTLTLECGHQTTTQAPNVFAGMPWGCTECPPWEKRPASQYCTDVELDVASAFYAETMRLKGFTIGAVEMAAIKRAAAIQDAWRVAFAKVKTL